MVRIKFTAHGANSAIGGFQPGDMARVGESMARHLVDEACVAVYAQPQLAAAAVLPEKKSRKRKGNA